MGRRGRDLLAQLERICDELDEFDEDRPLVGDPWRTPRVPYLARLVREAIDARPYDHERFKAALGEPREELPGVIV